MSALTPGHFMVLPSSKNNYNTKKTQINNNTFLDVLKTNKKFSTFYELVRMSKTEYIFNSTLNNNFIGNSNLLNNKKSYTLFLPENQYLDKYSDFLSNIDYATARAIVLYHVVEKSYSYNFLKGDENMNGNNVVLKTISTDPMNKKLQIISKDNKVYINSCNKIFIKGGLNSVLLNGVVHVIDDLIIPPSHL